MMFLSLSLRRKRKGDSEMNLLEHYITNITHEEQIEKNGMLFFKVVCDVDCYGNKEVQTEVLLSEDDYAEAKSKGYYLA